ncbi:MAG: hypothetical protein ABI361_10510 [Nitrososphaera sp.]
MLFGSHGNSSSGVRRNATFSERANTALANLQRNSYAMSVLRGRLESKLSHAASSTRASPDSPELAKMLELVKSGELLLNEMAAKVESARVLEEFMVILDAAAASVSEITVDMEKMVPTAEKALQEMHDAIIKTTIGEPHSAEQEKERQNIMQEAATAGASDSLEQVASLEKQGQAGLAETRDDPTPDAGREEEPLPA